MDPTPYELWVQAKRERPDDTPKRYLELMREAGYVLMPGDEGYEQGVKPGESCPK